MIHNRTKCIMHTVLEYCENSQNLTEYIKSHGPFNEIHSRLLFKLVLNAIEDMHREGLCHRYILY
jgi:serine/threonine protein kinase